MKGSQTINFEWWNSADNSEPNDGHKDELSDHALKRAASQIDEGFTSGELLTDIEDVSYRGSWELV